MPGINPFDFQAIGGEIIGAEEIVGADESVAELLGIMGDDDDDDDDFDVGAAVRKQAKAVRQVQKAVQAAKLTRALAGRKKAMMGLGTIQTEPNLGRYLYGGNTALQGASAGSLDVTITLQERFRPQRMTLTYVDNTGAAVSLSNLNITDILCGTRSQLVALGNLPAQLFNEQSTGQTAGVMFDTVGPGCAFTVRFATVLGAHRVTVGISGAAVR